ncbi:MAG: type IV pilus modification PilV family protein [Phycisphaerales bacterium]|jgi:hypothetical protein
MVTYAIQHGCRHRGFALVDAIIAGLLLAIGLAAIISLGSRALSLQQRGEREVVAASLLDEILATVLMEGPADYPKLHSMSGVFDEPFAAFEYEVAIDEGAPGVPFRVVATVRHESGDSYSCETLIAPKLGEEPDPPRQPLEPIDREAALLEAESEDQP